MVLGAAPSSCPYVFILSGVVFRRNFGFPWQTLCSLVRRHGRLSIGEENCFDGDLDKLRLLRELEDARVRSYIRLGTRLQPLSVSAFVLHRYYYDLHPLRRNRCWTIYSIWISILTASFTWWGSLRRDILWNKRRYRLNCMVVSHTYMSALFHSSASFFCSPFRRAYVVLRSTVRPVTWPAAHCTTNGFVCNNSHMSEYLCATVAGIHPSAPSIPGCFLHGGSIHRYLVAFLCPVLFDGCYFLRVAAAPCT